MIQLYVVAGPAASGKSEFSKILSEKSGNTWLDFDENIDELIETNKDLIKTEGMEFFLRKFREVRYTEFISKAMYLLHQGRSVIISAPFTSEVSSQKKWEKLFAEVIAEGIRPKLYWIATKSQVRRDRMKARGAERDIEKRERYEFDELTPQIEHTLINGEDEFESQVQEILKKRSR